MVSITFSKYVCIHVCVCTQKTRRAKDSNNNPVISGQQDYRSFLCAFLIFSNVSKMYMCYFHYLKQILFFKRKIKKWSSSSILQFLLTKNFHQIPQGLVQKAIFVVPTVPTQNITHRTGVQTQRVTSHPLWGTLTRGHIQCSYIFCFIIVQGFLIMVSLASHKQCHSL